MNRILYRHQTHQSLWIECSAEFVTNVKVCACERDDEPMEIVYVNHIQQASVRSIKGVHTHTHLYDVSMGNRGC